MIALMIALAAQSVTSKDIADKATELYLVAACQRYATDEDRATLDIHHYDTKLQPLFDAAIRKAEAEPAWSKEKCEFAADWWKEQTK